MYASSALDMCYVASGKADARIFANSELWDHAASSLIVEEAGGKVTNWKGEKWNNETVSLLVTNGKIHDKLIHLVND